MTTGPPAPWALLAELTHSCPLQCGYCSNPVELTRRSQELSTDTWVRVLREAADLGVVQTHLSGGEPLLRRDLDVLVAAASEAGVYTQLVTSGLGLDGSRLAALTDAGLRSVQLSVQHSDQRASDLIAGTRSFHAKERAAAAVRESGLPLGVNVVLHRRNLDALDGLIELAVNWGAERVELANTQFYGWGLLNRTALMPTRAQLATAAASVERWRERLAGTTEIVWVLPDYFEGVAKRCMGGWGSVSLTVAPDGTVLPCPAAASLPNLDPPNVRDHPLDWIWSRSETFNVYRGTDWMQEPCRTCLHRDEDLGGCRCQALALTGDATRADPACSLSPDHAALSTLAVSGPSTVTGPLIPRRPGGARPAAPVATPEAERSTAPITTV
ncbi:pyrroloquinoline quinone biosynthesis protein PqqE [Streptomyces sp. CBMA29]|uniref:pyrroloquinoline quinone biosynthesis protein PqqE n=1 Tax=Streptomyces sp. CBMA29 TaxID=1896314 RepID=UPI00166191AD|nr:pyrroloquinoline quinone biosynthesis protein PqqE [Streptomyces sp. CBMA29]